MSLRKLSLSDFTAHAEEELRAVVHGHEVVAITQNGQVVAYVNPVPQAGGNGGNLGDWLGRGVGYSLAPGMSLDDPAWSAQEWEDVIDSE